jgi:GNAT superfamily N-acetyltransferase
MPYINYEIKAHAAEAAGYWGRRDFLRAWWATGGDDEHWTPPAYGRLRRELNPAHNAHLARLAATLIHVEALQRTGLRRSRTDQQEIPLTSVFERPLAAAAAVIDPRRKGGTAQLALTQFSSDGEAFDRLYYYLVEEFSARRHHRFVAPVGLSPHLNSGLLVDGWDARPPLHTPANPPYTPELIERRLRPFLAGRLYHSAVAPAAGRPGPATIMPFDPARLAGDLMPLLTTATENPAGFPPPDEVEAAFLLRQMPPGTRGFLAEMDGAVAGFVLIGPDTAGQLRTTRGGRPLWGRAYLQLARWFSGWSRVTAGRLFFGGVLPDRRGQGVGRQLWERAMREAQINSWAGLSVGPIWGTGGAAAFLAQQGAVAQQTYHLYEASF